MPVATLYRVRGNQPSIEDLPQGSIERAVANPDGALELASALGTGYSELPRLRKSFEVVRTSTVPSVTALPTTTAQLVLWNGENAHVGRIYVIDTVGMISAGGVKTASSFSLCVCLGAGRQSAPTASNDARPRGTAGQVYTGYAVAGVDEAVADDGWFPVGDSVVGPADQTGLIVEVPVRGSLIVLPGHRLSIAVLANDAHDVRPFVRWHEVGLGVGS